MADILHDFPIRAPASQVFRAVPTPAGLDAWWTIRSKGRAERGAEFELWFGSEYDWRAVVESCEMDKSFELRMTRAMEDWMGTRVGFRLEEKGGVTQVRFRHLGWPEANEHYRVSCVCWAMYLRLLRRYVETGEIVPYERRLEV